MTFQQLQYLLAINRTGSVSLAAKELFVTQSSVSIALASLESELNCRIFVRSTHGLTLTAEGRQVIGHAQRICESHKLLTDSVKPTKPQLRIGSIEYAPARDAFLKLLGEHHNRKDMTFAYCGVANYLDRISRGEVDIAVNLSFSQYDEQVTESAKKQKIYCEKLASLPATICIGKGHRLYNVPDVKPEDFSNDCLLEAVGKPITGAKVLLNYLTVNPERTLECNNMRLAQDLRHSGHVYSISHLTTKKLRENTDLRYIPIPGLRYSVFTFWDSVRTLSPEAVRYLELLKDEIAHTQL